MANPIKGEVPLEVDGHRYVFVLGTYGLAALERKLGMPFQKIFEKAAKAEWSIGDIVAMVHAGLLRNHPDLTEQQAADLIDSYGLQSTLEMIGESLQLMQPGGQGAENPPGATASRSGNGTGTSSSPTG